MGRGIHTLRPCGEGGVVPWLYGRNTKIVNIKYLEVVIPIIITKKELNKQKKSVTFLAPIRELKSREKLSP